MYEIVVMGTPRGKQRPGFKKSGKAYTPTQTKDYEKEIAMAWRKKYGNKMACGYLRLAVFAYFAPRGDNSDEVIEQKLKNSLPTMKYHPDVDNILKAAADGLNKVAYKDDSQITTMYCTKRYAKNSYIKIQISEEDT